MGRKKSGARAVVVLLLAAAGSAATAAPPRGPSFGNCRIRTEITAEATPDVDDYVAHLVEGETLTVAVTSDRGSSLLPGVAVLDPLDDDRTPALAVRSRGRSVSFRNLRIDRTGPWTVRIAGLAGSTGAYTARFSLRSSLGATYRRQAVGGAGPAERTHAFPAVEGATVSAVLSLARGSAAASVTAVADPSGAAVPLAAPRVRGRTATWTAVPLAAGDGAYGVTVGLDEGAATYDLRLRVAPPVRPTGTIALTPDEPRVAFDGVTIEGDARENRIILGSKFASSPLPQVWFGDLPAEVLGVYIGGSQIEVRPPALPVGTVVDLTVVNPDGQATTVPDWFRSVVPPPPALAQLAPGTASVYAGTTLTYVVKLTAVAPLGGLSVELATEGPVGVAPPRVTVSAGQTEAAFGLAAAAVPATGKVRATYDGVVREADVSVVAIPGGGGGGGGGGDPPPPPLPDEIDVSGWTLVQANSARTYAIPQGTRLRQGDYVVVARACTKAQFEAYWGVTLGADVVFLTNDATNTSQSTDDWPSINGGETYSLRDASGATVDGPTAAMASAAGENWQRTAGADASQAASWTVSTNLAASGGAPTPGRGQAASATKHGVYVSEFSDASGTGAFVYEFVELHFDGLKP